jgi:hypothetical protein
MSNHAKKLANNEYASQVKISFEVIIYETNGCKVE